MILRSILYIVAAGVILYAFYEVRLWNKYPDIVSERQRKLRAFGFIFLVISLGLWIRGTYLHVPVVHNGHIAPEARSAAFYWVGYWCFTFLMLAPLIPLALLDAKENLKRAIEQRRIYKQELFGVLNSIDTNDEEEPAETGETATDTGK